MDAGSVSICNRCLTETTAEFEVTKNIITAPTEKPIIPLRTLLTLDRLTISPTNAPQVPAISADAIVAITLQPLSSGIIGPG
jgi:hypothetical protein